MTKKVFENTLARKSDTKIILISLKHLYMYKNLKYKKKTYQKYIYYDPKKVFIEFQHTRIPKSYLLA